MYWFVTLFSNLIITELPIIPVSRYYLNDKATNYKEISIFLRQQGIDLDHNRFLILQGEVESIALMKSKGTTPHEEGMLEFLEDIIGSSR